MAAKKQNKQEETDEAREQTTAEKNPCLGCDLDCTTCKVNGAKTLRRAACQTLKRESETISDIAGDESERRRCEQHKAFAHADGDTTGRKWRQEDETVAGKSAQALAEEPEWSEEVS